MFVERFPKICNRKPALNKTTFLCLKLRVSMALTEKLAHKDRLVPKVPVERLDQLVSAV